MELGMVGLGRMGLNMVRRLEKAGHHCVAWDRKADVEQSVVKDGAFGTTSLEEFVGKLTAPRVVWLMVPAAVVDTMLEQLVPLLQADDVVIDGGNSYYHDDIRRAAELKPKGIHYVDAGTSGGVWGSDRGYCLMIGGEDAIVSRCEPIFAALAPGIEEAARTPGREKRGGTAEHGYLHCGPNGAGHFVKMVHNGIEYGMMASYAEGLNILRHANAGKGKAPSLTMVTPAPTAETSPIASWPGINGGVGFSGHSPREAWISVPQTPQASVLTTIWPGPGVGTSHSRSTNGLPNCSTTAACMVLLCLLDVDATLGSSVAVLMGSSSQIG
jgi:6-phosphogluconate dehydrogenase (decarboxylating)